MAARDISWLKAALKDFADFPAAVQLDMLTALRIAAGGGKADTAKPFKGVGPGVFEIAEKHRGDAFRVIYVVRIGDDLWVVDAFQKKSTSGIKTPQVDVDRIRARLKAVAGGPEVSDDLVHGSGNVFRDLGHPEADILQMKADLAARIIHELEARKLTVRAASAATGFAAADFSRVRQAKVRGFTLDKLVGMLVKLDQRIEVGVHVRPRPAASAA